MKFKKLILTITALAMILLLAACDGSTQSPMDKYDNHIEPLPSWFANATWTGTFIAPEEMTGESLTIKTTSNDILLPGFSSGFVSQFDNLKSHGSFTTSTDSDSYFITSIESIKTGNSTITGESTVEFRQITTDTILYIVTGTFDVTGDSFNNTPAGTYTKSTTAILSKASQY